MAARLKQRWRMRAGLWFAALALLLQTVLPAVHTAPAPGWDRAAFEGAHTLCLAPGAVPPAEHDKAPAHKLPPCPICQTFQMLGAGYAPPAVVAIQHPRGVGAVAHPVYVATCLPYRAPAGIGARGPPVSV
jgi:hypothetical protein